MTDTDTKQPEDLEEIQEDDPIVAEPAENNEEITQLQKEVEEHKTKYLRVLADYQNLEKRVQEQRRELMLGASRQILLQILPILDTLQLAKKHSEDKAISASVQQFLAILQSEGVTIIETVGKTFDPILMECVTTRDGKENIVLEELRAGYMLNDKLLRTAQVVVGSAEQNSEEKN